MAAINYQYELMKMYLAAFLRAPEKSGLEYWLYQLENGKSFEALLETVFSLDIVKAIYPDKLANVSFVTSIYANVFGKVPDLEGLNYWVKQIENGRGRGGLVMDMINAGLTTPEGTPGKAYLVNRMAVAQIAVDQQLFQKAELSPDYLKSVMATVTADIGTVSVASRALSPSVTGIGLGAPLSPLVVSAAAGGLSAAEIKAGVAVVIDLKGTNAVTGYSVELLLNRTGFLSPVSKIVTDADIKAQKLTITIPASTLWGADGSKTLSAIVRDSVGNLGLPGGDVVIDVNAFAPNGPSQPLVIPAASLGINAVEKAAGIEVIVDLRDTMAGVGDKLEILLDGQVFSPESSFILTDAVVQAGRVSLTISGKATWGSDGEKNIVARLTDVAGNVGVTGGNVVVTLDATPPKAFPLANALVIPLAAGGLGPSERLANIPVQVDLKGGNFQVGDTLELLIDGKRFAISTQHLITSSELDASIATLNISGGDFAWGSVDGERLLTVRVIDSAGNLGVAGGNLKVVLDSQAPYSQYVMLSVSAATNGISAAEKAAGMDVSVNLTGTAAMAGDSVQLLLGGLPFTTITSPSTQGFSRIISAADVAAKSLTITIPADANWGGDGNKSLTARMIDAAGNAGAVSAATEVLLDTTAPLTLSGAVAIAVASNGINAAEKSAGMNALISLTGSSAIAGEKIELMLNGAAFATPLFAILSAADLAAASVTLAIPSTADWGSDGSKILSARIVDVAGNPGASGANLTLSVDSTAPTASSVALQVAANSGGGITAAEKAAGVVATVSLVGTGAVSGDTLEILLEGAAFATPVSKVLSAADVAAMSVNLSILATSGWGVDGTKNLSARVTDIAGNVGVAGGSLALTMLDGTAPIAPTIALVAAAAGNGISLAEKAAGLVITGNLIDTQAVLGDVANILIDGAAFASAVTYALTAGDIKVGSFSLTIPATAGWGADGAHVLSLSITDAASNVGVAGANLTVSLDTIAPVIQPNAVTVLAAASGLNSSEKIASMLSTVNLAGTGAVAGDQVELLLGGSPFTIAVTAVLSSAHILAGSVSLSIPANAGWGADGVKTISARITDIAGNIGLAGGTLTTTLDTTIPAAVGLPAYTDVDSSGTINSGDRFVFTISEASNKAITISNLTTTNSHVFGTGASAVWNVAGTQLTLTLGTSTTIALGDIITLVGVSDVAGNSLNMAFSL